MNTWHIEGESPFGGAIVPPMLVSHFVLSVQFDHTKPFAIGSIHTFHDSEIIAPIPVGATVRITTKATDKYVKRERRYVRHEVTVTDVGHRARCTSRETRDILSLMTASRRTRSSRCRSPRTCSGHGARAPP